MTHSTATTVPEPEPTATTTAILERLERIEAQTNRIEQHAAAMEATFSQLSAVFGDLGGLADLMPGGLGSLLGAGNNGRG